MYGIEKRDIGKFAKIINESKYILYIEPKNESKQKGKYFLPTTKFNKSNWTIYKTINSQI